MSRRAGLWTSSSYTTEMIAAATVVVRRLWVPRFRYAKAGVMLDTWFEQAPPPRPHGQG